MRKLEGIDLFCGAGGVTSGIHMAKFRGMPIARVVAAINHDPLAIESHAANHPCTIHFNEDIRTFDVNLLPEIKNRENKIVFIWASLECTNFSNAKGGLPRDADSRTLAQHLFRYIEKVNPDYIFIENVREFMAWGPLDSKGKPLSRKRGRDYLNWVQKICEYGYDYDWKLLNAADFGAYTSRIRYFGIFGRKGLPIRFPRPTHAKNPEISSLNLKRWKAVKEVLDLEDEGESIFSRKKPLVDRTLRRILAGLKKYVKNNDDTFLQSYYGSGTHNHRSIDKPAGTLTTRDRLAKVKVDRFLYSYYGDDNRVHSPDEPAVTITTANRIASVSAIKWIDKRYNGYHNHQNLEKPAGTLTTTPKLALVSANWLDKQYKDPANHQNIMQPAGTITVNPKLALMSAKFVMPSNFDNKPQGIEGPLSTITANRKHHYLVNPQFSCGGHSVDSPCFTLIARMDKKPPYLVATEEGHLAIPIHKTDSEVMREIKLFMGENGIIDIKMRMLKIPELKRITGFNENYVLKGTKGDQKKFIGNAVPVDLAKVIIEEIFKANLGDNKVQCCKNLPMFKAIHARKRKSL